LGPCKVKVDGNAANIAIGDALMAHATGLAQKADAGRTTVIAGSGIFAVAWGAATADGDIIPAFIIGSSGKIS
jgi:hypothetical protein